MAVILALGAAITYGTADFLGGISAKRATTWTVVVLSQACGLAVLVALLPALPAATVERSDYLWGAAAGTFGGFGLLLFFQALSLGNMSVVAPIAAVVGAAVPVTVGVALGERPPVLAALGIALALPAIALISREHIDSPVRTSPRLLGFAALAGLGFGAFFALVDQSGDGAGIHPLIGARGASVLVLGILGTASRRIELVGGRVLAAILVSGALDMTANVLFLYSAREGLLAIGSVISSMYPASTVVLARVMLGERLEAVQRAGLGLAAVAVAFVALA